MSAQEHREAAGDVDIRFAVLTVSDTRTVDTDKSGQLIVTQLDSAGFTCAAHAIVRDEVEEIRSHVSRFSNQDEIDAIILTGGTGISSRDITPEALEPLFDAELPGFGEVFRWLSFQEIGSAAILSRAIAGRVGRVFVAALPGSTAAVRLACEQLLVPELRHLVGQLRR